MKLYLGMELMVMHVQMIPEGYRFGCKFNVEPNLTYHEDTLAVMHVN